MKLVAGLVMAMAAALPAQGTDQMITRADSMLSWGQVFSAESLYYRAASMEPRNPAARLALGRYLAARGVLRVGAVLMEEALYFGGNADTVARHLAPVYAALGDWRTLATLRGATLSFGERARAEWLMRHAPDVEGPDSAFVPYSPSDSIIGYVTIIVGADTLDATIDPRVQGLVLDSAFRRRTSVRRFQSKSENDWRKASWIANSVIIGQMRLENVPIRLEPTGHSSFARIGLDELGRHAPTFDPVAGRLLLRRTGRVRRSARATEAVDPIPMISMRGTIWLIQDNQIIPIDGPGARSLMHSRWTLNPRQGQVIPES